MLRLRQAAVDALQRYDLQVGRIRLLLSEFNCLYRIEGTDGAEYVLRLSNAWGSHGADETRAELAWLDALRRGTGLIVPQAVPMRDGDCIGTVDPELAPSHRQWVLFRWIPGRALGDRIGVTTAARLGRYTAQLHEQALSWSLPRGCRARRFDRAFPYADPDFPEPEPVLVFDRPHQDLLTPRLQAVYREAEQAVDSVIKTLFEDQRRIRIIHNDLHPWNVLTLGDTLGALDFEDLMWGHPIQDIATTFYYLRIRDDGPRLEAAYRRGYESVAPWPGRDTELSVMIAGRGLILANTVLTAPEAEIRAKASHYLPLIGERMARWL